MFIPEMTREHRKYIAHIIRMAKTYEKRLTMALLFADHLNYTDIDFNKERFLLDCDIGANDI